MLRRHFSTGRRSQRPSLVRFDLIHRHYSDALEMMLPLFNLVTPILAQAAANKSYSLPWAIVLFCVILGLLVTLAPSRRTSEIKRGRDE